MEILLQGRRTSLWRVGQVVESSIHILYKTHPALTARLTLRLLCTLSHGGSVRIVLKFPALFFHGAGGILRARVGKRVY